MTTNEPMFTVEEVAKMLRVSKMTVYRLIDQQEITHIRVGRSFRIPRSGFDEYCRVNLNRAFLK